MPDEDGGLFAEDGLLLLLRCSSTAAVALLPFALDGVDRRFPGMAPGGGRLRARLDVFGWLTQLMMISGGRKEMKAVLK